MGAGQDQGGWISKQTACEVRWGGEVGQDTAGVTWRVVKQTNCLRGGVGVVGGWHSISAGIARK